MYLVLLGNRLDTPVNIAVNKDGDAHHYNNNDINFISRLENSTYLKVLDRWKCFYRPLLWKLENEYKSGLSFLPLMFIYSVRKDQKWRWIRSPWGIDPFKLKAEARMIEAYEATVDYKKFELIISLNTVIGWTICYRSFEICNIFGNYV